MKFGAHLPLIEFEGSGHTLSDLRSFAERAERLGYDYLCVNDHIVFPRPWIDGPTALAAVLDLTGAMRLATTVSIPVVRGPVQTAKLFATIDALCGGRLTVGVGPGSSQLDHAAVGLKFEERWKRLDEAIEAMRALWNGSGEFHGDFYSFENATIEPTSDQEFGPPIWIGSWGSQAGLRRVARLGDGWLASGYNTNPKVFREGLSYLSDQLRQAGKSPETFPNGIATIWTYVTEDKAAAERAFTDVLGPMLNRPIDELKDRLLIGSAEHCAEMLSAYAEAGAQHAFVWPIADELEQLDRFQERVAPRV